MNAPSVETLKQQLREAVRLYYEEAPKLEGDAGADIAAAMLSGMSLVADFLIKCDGSKTMNAHIVAKAVREVGEEMNLVYNRLKDGHPQKKSEVPELGGQRCPKCQGMMYHTRLAGYRCNRGCQ